MFTLVIQHRHVQLQAPLADKGELETLQSALLARREHIDVDLEQPPSVAAAVAARLLNLQRYSDRLSAPEQEAGANLVTALGAHLLLSRSRWRPVIQRARWALALRIQLSLRSAGPGQVACDLATDGDVDLVADAGGTARRVLLGLKA